MVAEGNVAETVDSIANRRAKRRYPIEENVQYRVPTDKTGTSGTGKTINMGSAGVLFTAEHRLPIGRKVELSIAWPALLDGVCRLKLVATGVVVRAEERTVAVRLLRHEFRTRSSRQ